MNYVQHTKCVQIGDKTWPAWAPSPVTSLILVSIPVLLASIVIPYVAAVEVPLLIIYCRWWLYDRLICLGGEKCAIGMLGSVEPPEEKSGFDAFDTDYSINLVLAPHNIQELPADYPDNVPPPPDPLGKEAHYHSEYLKALNRAIADDGMQGYLIREQTITSNANWDFQGYLNKIAGSMVLHHYQAYLHCEFEGGGIWKLYQALLILLPISTATAITCAIPFFGWIVCAILGAVALVIAIAGVVLALNDKGSPSAYDPKTKETRTKLETKSDILFVKGDWVFDTAHEGWNEIHPIKDCKVVGKVKYLANASIDWDDAIGSFMVAAGRWAFDNTNPKSPTFIKVNGPARPEDWTAWVKAECDGLGTASSSLTIKSQEEPSNRWEIHPAIDGCAPAERPPKKPDIR